MTLKQLITAVIFIITKYTDQLQRKSKLKDRICVQPDPEQNFRDHAKSRPPGIEPKPLASHLSTHLRHRSLPCKYRLLLSNKFLLRLNFEDASSNFTDSTGNIRDTSNHYICHMPTFCSCWMTIAKSKGYF